MNSRSTAFAESLLSRSLATRAVGAVGLNYGHRHALPLGPRSRTCTNAPRPFEFTEWRSVPLIAQTDR